MGLIENALVVLWNGKRAYWGLTDSEGKLQLKNVIAGTYKYMVYKDGYACEYGELIVDGDKAVTVTISKIPPYYFTGVVNLVESIESGYELRWDMGKDLSLSVGLDHELEVKVPETATIYPSDDAFVFEGNPTANYNLTYLQFKTREDKDDRIFLKFDISSLPEDAEIQFARLRLYCYEAYNLISGVTDLEARRVSDDSWDETSITWNNQPSLGDVEDTIEPTVGGWNEWDVTGFVQDEWAGDKIVSLCVKCVQEDYDDTDRYGNFCAKEWDSSDPRLVIYYYA